MADAEAENLTHPNEPIRAKAALLIDSAEFRSSDLTSSPLYRHLEILRTPTR